MYTISNTFFLFDQYVLGVVEAAGEWFKVGDIKASGLLFADGYTGMSVAPEGFAEAD